MAPCIIKIAVDLFILLQLFSELEQLARCSIFEPHVVRERSKHHAELIMLFLRYHVEEFLTSLMGHVEVMRPSLAVNLNTLPKRISFVLLEIDHDGCLHSLVGFRLTTLNRS